MSRGSSPIVATSGHPEPPPASGLAEIGWLRLPDDGRPIRWCRRSAVEQICIVLPLDAPVLVRVGAGTGVSEWAAHPGEGMVVVGQDEFVAASAGACGGRALVLSSARAPIDALIGAACRTGCLHDSVVLRAATRFLLDLESADGGIGALRMSAIERLLRELIVAVLADDRETRLCPAPWLGLLDRAMEHIAGHCTDQRLGTELLARTLNVSVRHLQRAFAETGSTPQREIRRHRTALAARVLGDRAFAALSIDQISHQCGFRNAADMRRALACHELPAPSVLRSAPRAV